MRQKRWPEGSNAFRGNIRRASNHFPQLKGPPKGSALKFAHINEFDWLIRGWTRYWNEIFQLTDPLNPIAAKALIGSESSFDPDPPPVTSGAAGLMQLLDKTRRISLRELSTFRCYGNRSLVTGICEATSAGLSRTDSNRSLVTRFYNSRSLIGLPRYDSPLFLTTTRQYECQGRQNNVTSNHL